MNEYQKESSARAEAFHAHIHAVAASMGWTFEPYGDEQEWYARGYLHGPALSTEHGTAPRKLFVSMDRTKPTAPRVNVSGSFPGCPTAEGRETVRIWRDLATYAERESGVTHEISCAMSRKPDAIAADIHRRLLPTYDDFLARAIDANAARVSHLDSGKRNAETIARACRGAVDSRDSIEYKIRANGLPMIRVNGDSVRFEYLYCTTDQAVRIAAILSESQA
jgi:hypothetical protein